MNLLSSHCPACSEEEVEDDPIAKEALLKVTIHVLEKMKETDLMKTLEKEQLQCGALSPILSYWPLDVLHEPDDLLSIYQKKYKSRMKDKYKRICETSQHGTPSLLNEIYTELNITKAWTEGINTEHEVRHLEAASRRSTKKDKCIQSDDLFRDKSIRTVLTKGVAGIGKTFSVQKFILDWAEGKANQDVTFMFPLPFRELNLMKKKNLSLINLLHQFFPGANELQSINCDGCKVVLIFDGLDECRLPLNFENNESLCDATESASVDVLLTNLIKGNLLPSAHLWITTRPGAANQIPLRFVGQVTEVQGFTDAQKEEYFMKSISDQSLAKKIIKHIKSSKSLYIMCHLPVFCWITATVLERMLSEAESEEIPKTLTQMFTHFLIFQIKHKDQKYHQRCEPDPQQTRESIMALGKLAFQQLEKGNLIFSKKDLMECGINVREATVYSGVCTQIFREEFELQLGKVFSFIHLSVQEFLAALYAFLAFINRNQPEHQTTDLSDLFNNSSMSDFLRSAVDKALESENGQLDLFLRFLLGLSLESNQTLLRSLLPQTGSSAHRIEETVEYIKGKIRENPSPEMFINLFHCLNELNYHSLVKEIQSYLNPGGYTCLRQIKLSSIQWSALVFVLLNSTQEHEEFDLRSYSRSEECLLRLLPVVKESRKAVLCGCNLSEESCKGLSTVISSKCSKLRELNLSENNLWDKGVKLLAEGLKNEECKLEKLWLVQCGISDVGFVALALALESNPMSKLQELNLNCNEHGNKGIKMLSDLQKDPNCTLETLHIEPDPYELNKTSHSYNFNRNSTNPVMDVAEFVILQKRNSYK
ncbi:NLR family CARD domain-containing protein 3-like isoform X1 [Silurus meridionalis]|uniref:NLR family CARD domain-containing protein 3-like isoform X1 n=1 Tax=Silurus meridionalis TaxID=175797 RepID=UPI001EEA428F|nr:NLR family CARD domain-containing protein 3-like isoform X1 [Silurus meridionalis]XP_046709154.1 NLR family CARD domain-containing protein 3-like isoform X1 [Silurus meridionalis]XP_046709162.1 NLR family CARD domain-containing protein 3-like isoform X1 [Silurus meridionalis]